MDVQSAHARTDVLAGRFVLERVLGSGGMATVWSAHDTRLDRDVALKILRSDLTEDHTGRIEREARAAARIDDHRVVTVLDLEHTDDGTPFLVFEALSGLTLADELRASGTLSVERAQRLASDLLGGLAAAHECGVLHRDVKPSNVLIDDEGFRITDFGIASMDDDESTTGDLMGTLVYLAPERFDGAPATPRSDVFSAAAVLYEAFTGRQPFRSVDSAASLTRLRTGTFDPLPPRVPGRVAAAIEDGLSPDPTVRPADAGAFARRIDPSAVDATEQIHVDDLTERLTSRLDQPTEPHLPRGDDPSRTATDDAPASPADAPAAETPAGSPSPGRTTGAWDIPNRSATGRVAARLKRPQAFLVALSVVLLVLLLFAAGAGDDTAEPPTEEPPEQQVLEHLDRIEEIGR